MPHFAPKFVTLGKAHFNANDICGFAWSDGVLHVVGDAPSDSVDFEDPDRDMYLYLCSELGVDPV